jgi:hypothetical protein
LRFSAEIWAISSRRLQFVTIGSLC